MTSSPPRESKLPTAKTVVSAIGSVAAAAMVARSVARDYLPPEFQHYLSSSLRNLFNKLSPHLTIVIHQFHALQPNDIYNAVELYLSSKTSPDINRLNITKNPTDNNNNIYVSMEINNETFTDDFNGVKFKWRKVSKKSPISRDYNYYNMHDDSDGYGYGYGLSTGSEQRNSFEVTFHKKHRELVIKEYIPFILNEASKRKLNDKTVKLYTMDTQMMYAGVPIWTSVNLNHPSTFATLAMDGEVKESVIKDLDRFVERRDYYRKVGKAWKRGYLLYGPPGTGKSSLVAAMANYLKFDIYDLGLTGVRSNSELRRLLVATANRSILVVEDIDCSVELHDRAAAAASTTVVRQSYGRKGVQEEHRVTLSGFLNFIDGLWSSCGDERIIIFTTNRKEKLDPALLRPGRMDVHINMSYCTPCGFRLLVSNYLGVTQHDRFEEIEDLIRKVEITPAEVAEQLLKDSDPDIALGGLVEFFDEKRRKEQQLLAAKESEEKQ